MISQGHLVLRNRPFLPLDKVDALVPEGAGPVRVDVEVARDVRRDHHRLWLVAVQEGLR